MGVSGVHQANRRGKLAAQDVGGASSGDDLDATAQAGIQWGRIRIDPEAAPSRLANGAMVRSRSSLALKIRRSSRGFYGI